MLDAALDGIGILVKQSPLGLHVVEVPEDHPDRTAICRWNSKCRSTYVEDVLRSGDLIKRINDVVPDTNEGEHWCDPLRLELQSAGRKTLIVERCGAEWW